MPESPVDRVIRGQNWMDRPADLVQRLVGGAYGAFGPVGRGLKKLMHGTWPLGHPLHPAITDIPMGAWTAAAVLDIVSHYTSSVPHRAAELVLLVGIIAAVGAAVTGYTDFHETFGHERRVGFTHGITMTVVLILMVVSGALRHWGGADTHTLAVGLSFAGLILMFVGGYLGGHLVFGMGTTVNRNAFYVGSDDFADVGSTADFPEGKLQRVMLGDLPVLVVRRSGNLCAIGAVCSHAGGPLDEGALEHNQVTCPWHGSVFDVCSGTVTTGPATFNQPVLAVREVNGRVAVKPAIPMH